MIHKPAMEDQRGQKAQAMVEFALAVPIVLVLVLAVFDFGRLLFVYTTLTAATREAARYGSGVGSNGSVDLYNDCAGIRAAAIRVGRYSGLQPTDIHIFHDSGPDTAETEYCTSTPNPQVFQPDDRIVVRASTGFTPVTPLVNIPALTLKSENSHTVLMKAKVDAAFNTSDTGGQKCDTSKYGFTITPSTDGSGHGIYTVNFVNNSTTNLKIKEVVVYWTPFNTQCNKNCLLSITDPANSTTTLNLSNGIFDLNLYPSDWDFAAGTSDTFSLTYTNLLTATDEPVVSLYLDTTDTCGFGNWGE